VNRSASGDLLEFLHRWGGRLGLLKPSTATVQSMANHIFFLQLMEKTNNFTNTRWLGREIRQNVLDLWVIQETISDLRPELLIETGTHEGGSALFYANLFDLLGYGQVITVDVEKNHDFTHPRIEFLTGSSVDPKVTRRIEDAVSSASGHVMVILDSDHHEAHVRAELEAYAPLITPSSYLLVQDGIIDTMPILRKRHEPGPLPAIRDFLKRHSEFEVDFEKCRKFLVTHHPEGWLKKKETGAAARSPA
jgi:cephalosporin hydroxylase